MAACNALGMLLALWLAAESPDPLVEDWSAQERRLGRSAGSADAICAAMDRTSRLIEDLARFPQGPDLTRERADWKRLRAEAAGADAMDSGARLDLWLRARRLTRTVALKNPLVSGRPIAFLKRRRFTCQMLHEYLGYYYDYADLAGGGVCVLDKPGVSFAARDLTAGRLPRGNSTTLALSHDARTLWFAYCERAAEKPDFYSTGRRSFHLFAVAADGRELRQATFGPDDDFDPCVLPDGGVAFMSTRRGGFGRCHNPWEPLPSYTLHRLEPGTGAVRTLSYHETNEWHPSVLTDGRIVYTRWDYVDRSAANYHGLWTSNPDGTNPQVLFGNYTQRINACYQARAIPSSDRVVFVAGAHHAAVGGALVVLDPTRAGYERTGHDEFRSVEVLTPEVCFPEAPGWPKSYFHSPWPLAENYFLVSFSFDPLPGMGPGVNRDSHTGLYYFDRFGNLELLYREPGISAMYPIPLVPREVPPVVPSTLDGSLGDEGELLLANVGQSFQALPAARRIAALRVYQVLPKSETHVANQPRLGYANAESARMLLGTVPLERDGSVRFRVPARKPIYFQAIDAAGRAVQTMRSITYLQPGERRSCVGCHERPGTAPTAESMAARREASPLVPGPDGTRPFSFPRLVQPVLDRHCVRCHDGARPSSMRPDLTGAPSKVFSVAYESLRPFVRWYEWGGKSISEAVTLPGRGGADESPLTRILADAHHGDAVELSEEDRLRITVWLDSNAPFFGTYGPAEQEAQRLGRSIPPPRLQ